MSQLDRDLVVDLESGGDTREEVGFVGVDGLKRDEKGVNLVSCVAKSDSVPVENVNLLKEKKVDGENAMDSVDNKSGKDRRKTMSAKKPPRPPRPPKALSLDAADQKLIKELAELAMMKRARIERMKALKKMKAAKASSSTGNFVAMLFTVIFCLVIIFQGMCPGRSSPVSSQVSPQSALVADSGFISVHYFRNASASDSDMSSASPSIAEQVSGPNPDDNVRRAIG